MLYLKEANDEGINNSTQRGREYESIGNEL